MESRSVCVYIAAVALFCVPCLVTSESEDAMVTQGACPYPCTQGGHHYCYPLPCPLPPCAHPVKDAGACCSHCPTGKSERLTLNAPIATKDVWFSRLLKCLRSLYGKQCGPRSDCSYSGSTLFASILNSSVMLGNYLQQTTFSDAFFSWRFKG